MSTTQPATFANNNSALNINTNLNNGADNYDQIFDEDVQRFEATEYKQRYGERWKKLATSVRDVLQPDGTIIREYVIEDPSLLEQLSEDEENSGNVKPTDKINPTNSFVSCQPVKNNLKSSSGSFKMYASKNNNNTVNKDTNENKGEKYFQPIVSKKDEEEVDKEVETIHEQGEQLKKYTSNKDLAQQAVEYEIVDENGNQILLNGAEQLKSLAAQVNEVVQPDGSIVKEYVLNDPKIIEQIRNRIKAENNSNNNSLLQPTQNINNNNNNNNKEEPISVNNSNNTNTKPPSFNFNDTMSSTNATIASNINEINKAQIKNPKPVSSNSNESNPNKKDKTTKQEEFINAWCNNNENCKAKPPSPPSLPFLSQIQHQIQKLQKKTSIISDPLKSQYQNNDQIQNKIASQLSDKYIAEIDYQQTLNEKPKTKTSEQLNGLKQINQNMFQLKTKKGKALQFTITSDDPTESDIEEVKFIINKSIENLADSFEADNKNSFKNKQITSSAQNFSSSQNDNYFKSSSFQPGPFSNNNNNNNNQVNNSNNNSNDGSNNENTNCNGSSNHVSKSGSIGCFKNNQNSNELNNSQPKNFLNSNNSQIKHYPNMNPVNNSNKVYHVENKPAPSTIYAKGNHNEENRYSKELYSSNSGSNENLYAKHQGSNYQTHESVMNRSITNPDYKQDNYLRRSNSFGTGQDSTSSDTDLNYIRNKTKITNSKSNKKQNIFNGGTYTKSTINFSCQSYDSDFNELEEGKKDKYSSKLSHKSKPTKSSHNYSQMNRSVNNIYDSKHLSRDVTPEMTEQLLLKLLLQQISQKDQTLTSLPTFKTRINQNIVKDDYSSSSTIYNKNIVSENASLMMSPVDSSYSSKFNSIKNKLTHKSKNNFEFEVEDDFDDVSTTNQFRRYQPNNHHSNSSKTTQYVTQQQLLLKKPQTRSKKYTS